jgi:alkylation response protein AidB-like acyl-CoA dehydrogenase
LDAKTPGISATKLDKLGWRASDTAEIAFDNVEIPIENLMGEVGKGFPYIMQHFALERLIMAINAHARAEYAIEYTLEYMSQREAFGSPINKFQALRHTMVEHATEVEHCKIFNYAAVSRLNKGEYVVKEATMAKLKSTKVADQAIYDCLQMLGGYGYMEEYPLARLLRDSRLGPIGGGTSEILKEILSKMIIDNQNYKPVVK